MTAARVTLNEFGAVKVRQLSYTRYPVTLNRGEIFLEIGHLHHYL